MLCASRRALQLEEEYIKQMCDEIIAVKPDLIFTEKGVSGNDLNWANYLNCTATNAADLMQAVIYCFDASLVVKLRQASRLHI